MMHVESISAQSTYREHFFEDQVRQIRDTGENNQTGITELESWWTATLWSNPPVIFGHVQFPNAYNLINSHLQSCKEGNMLTGNRWRTDRQMGFILCINFLVSLLISYLKQMVKLSQYTIWIKWHFYCQYIFHNIWWTKNECHSLNSITATHLFNHK